MDANRKTVVQFGAGAIGRGFLGQLWCDAGYETVFVDVDPALVGALNARGGYPLRLVDNEQVDERRVGPVRAISPDESPAALAACDFAAVAVGASAFPALAAHLAAARALRGERFHVLVCENRAGAAALLGSLVDGIDFVDVSVGRMVPPPTDPDDPLRVIAEPYAQLPIDADAWRGPLPPVPGLFAVRPFAGYAARKLFTHNGGHALLAYEGIERGHAHVWQAALDPALVEALRGFWDETGAALIAEYRLDPAEQRAHEDDLLGRFRNRALGDTTARVARDPLRKLRLDDRLVGAALLCLKHGIEPTQVVRAIDAALRYAGPLAAEVNLPDPIRSRLEYTRGRGSGRLDAAEEPEGQQSG